MQQVIKRRNKRRLTLRTRILLFSKKKFIIYDQRYDFLDKKKYEIAGNSKCSQARSYIEK